MQDADPEAEHRPKMAGNCENGTFITKKYVLVQCCGSASIIMRIRIQDPKNVHMDPDPRG